MTSLTFTYSCPSNESCPQKGGVKKHPYYATHCLESFFAWPHSTRSVFRTFGILF